MKKWTTLFFLLVLGIFLKAQPCTPNPAYTQPGIWPDTSVGMDPGCQGMPYSMVFTIVVPYDTIISGFSFVYNFIRIDSISGLPGGISYSCAPPTCSFPGNAAGCVLVSGTCSTPGTYPITVYLTGSATNGTFGTITVPYTATGYELTIHPAPNPNMNPSGSVHSCSNSLTPLQADLGFSAYDWFSGGTPLGVHTDAYSPSVNGTYVVQVTDMNGCTGNDTAVVTLTDPPVLNGGQQDPTCGQSNGYAWVSPTGNPPFSTVWLSLIHADTLYSIPAGVYSVVVTDGLNCSDTMTFTLINPGAPSIDSLLGINPLCNGEANGSAEVFASGGASPYSYLWSNGSTLANPSSLSAGTYSVSVTDTNSCTSTSLITLTDPPALGGSTTGTDASCALCTDGTATISASGGTPPYSYSWSNGATTSSLSGLGTGPYSVTVTDANGCTHSDSVTVGFTIGRNEGGSPLSCVASPNPGNETITLRWNYPIQQGWVRIVSNLGQTLQSFELKPGAEYQINASPLAPGLYWIVWKADQQEGTLRWVKK